MRRVARLADGAVTLAYCLLPGYRMDDMQTDRSARRPPYQPTASVSYGVIPLLGGTGAALPVVLVGILDRISWFRRRPDPIPLTDLAAYAAIAFVIGFVAIVITILIQRRPKRWRSGRQ